MNLFSIILSNILCIFSPNSHKCESLSDSKSHLTGSHSPNFPQSNSSEWPIVSTQTGLVQGYSMKTFRGRNIYAFEGIPFAEPPIGNLRFSNPVPKRHSPGIINKRSTLRLNCIQVDLTQFFMVTGKEDCLYLNIYTPQLSNTSLLPVVFFIYGGAFTLGSKDQYGPAYLLDKDILLITVNYRLGIFGFLSTGESFLIQTPETHYAKADVSKVPWIVGFVPDEGNIYNIVMMLVPFAFMYFDKNFDRLAPLTLEYRGRVLDERKLSIAAVRKFYFGDRAIAYRTLEQHGQMYGDRYFISGIHRGMIEHSRVAPTYGYVFNYSGQFGILQQNGLTREEAGISHFDDMRYIFNSSLHKSISLGHPDAAVSGIMVDLWTNFVIKGQPLRTNTKGEEIRFWEPIDPRNPEILAITKHPQIIAFPDSNLQRIGFWDKLHISDLLRGSLDSLFEGFIYVSKSESVNSFRRYGFLLFYSPTWSDQNPAIFLAVCISCPYLNQLLGVYYNCSKGICEILKVEPWAYFSLDNNLKKKYKKAVLYGASTGFSFLPVV